MEQGRVQMCAARQAEILDCAASMLAPGGRLRLFYLYTGGK